MKTITLLLILIPLCFASCKKNSPCPKNMCKDCISAGGKWCSSYLYIGEYCVSYSVSCNAGSISATTTKTCPGPCTPRSDCDDCRACITNGGIWCDTNRCEEPGNPCLHVSNYYTLASCPKKKKDCTDPNGKIVKHGESTQVECSTCNCGDGLLMCDLIGCTSAWHPPPTEGSKLSVMWIVIIAISSIFLLSLITIGIVVCIRRRNNIVVEYTDTEMSDSIYYAPEPTNETGGFIPLQPIYITNTV